MVRGGKQKLISLRIVSSVIIIGIILMSHFICISKAEVCGNHTIKEKFSIYGYTEIIEIDENKNGKIWVIIPLKFEDLNYSFDYEFEFYLNYRPNFTISDIIVYPQKNIEGDEEQRKYLSYEITETGFRDSNNGEHHTAKTLSIKISSNVTNKYENYGFAFSYEVKNIARLVSTFYEPIDRFQIPSHFIDVEKIIDGNIHLFMILPSNADVPGINYFDSIETEAYREILNKIELNYGDPSGTIHSNLKLPIDIKEMNNDLILYKNETSKKYINLQYRFAKSWSFWALIISIGSIFISLIVFVNKKRKMEQILPSTTNYKSIRIILAISCLVFLGSGLIELFLVGDEARGLILFGLGMAIYSVYLAITSEKMMVSIGKGSFMHIDSNLKAISFQSINRLNDKQDRWFAILSWRTGLIEAERLIKFANEGERDSMVSPFITVMGETPWGDNRLRQDNRVSNAEVNWIIDIYKLIGNLNPSNRTLERLQQLFYDNIAQLQEGENFNQLLDRVHAFVQQHPNELFQRIE